MEFPRLLTLSRQLAVIAPWALQRLRVFPFRCSHYRNEPRLAVGAVQAPCRSYQSSIAIFPPGDDDMAFGSPDQVAVAVRDDATEVVDDHRGAAGVGIG